MVIRSYYKSNRELWRIVEIEFLHIADAVEAINGKLYMLGGCWTLHRSSNFPSNLRIGIALSILMSPEELEASTTHCLNLGIFGPHGSLIPEVPMQFAIDSRPASAEIPRRSIIALNTAVPIPAAGAYHVRVRVGDLERSVKFEAILSLQH